MPKVRFFHLRVVKICIIHLRKGIMPRKCYVPLSLDVCAFAPFGAVSQAITPKRTHPEVFQIWTKKYIKAWQIFHRVLVKKLVISSSPLPLTKA